MLRIAKKYSHLVHHTGCGCFSPDLQKASRRLEALSRRGFLSGLVAAAVATTFPEQGFAKAGGQPTKTLLRKARLFDSKAGALTDNVQVLVVNNQIAGIDRTNAPPPEDATVLDCRDGVIIPGLIDAHWHTIFAAVPLNLLLGGPVFSFKQAIDAGMIPGPRIYPSGAMITTSGGHGDLRLPHEIPRDGGRLSGGELLGGSAIADGIDDLKLRIREQLLQGASQIKLVGSGGVSSPRSPLDMTTFSEEDLRAAVGVVEDWNTYIAIHAYTPRAVQRAFKAGVICIEHAHLMDEETAVMIAEKGAWLSMQPWRMRHPKAGRVLNAFNNSSPERRGRTSLRASTASRLPGARTCSFHRNSAPGRTSC